MLKLTFQFGVLVILLCSCAGNLCLAQTPAEKKIQQHFQAAKEAEKTEDFDRAVAEYQAILKLSPELAEVSANLGLVFYLQHRDEEAIKAFQHALKIKPDLLTANLFLGMVYVRSNRYALSVEPLKKAIALNPNEVRAYLNLGLSYLELGREEDSAKILEAAAKLWPRDVEVLFNLGSVYSRLMSATYQKMAQLDPDSYRVHQLLGASYEARRDNKRAIEEYSLAVAKRPDMAGLHYALGNVYWKSGDLEKAESEFLEELKITPENYLATWKLGNIYLTRKQHDLAFKFLERAIQQNPVLGQAHRDLGRALIQTSGDMDRALRHLKKVTELAPEEPTSHYLLAQVYKKLGRRTEQNAELEAFEKLRKLQQGREEKARMMASPGDLGDSEFPDDTDVTQ